MFMVTFSSEKFTSFYKNIRCPESLKFCPEITPERICTSNYIKKYSTVNCVKIVWYGSEVWIRRYQNVTDPEYCFHQYSL